MTRLSRGSSDKTSASKVNRRTPSADTTTGAATSAHTSRRRRCAQRTVRETTDSTTRSCYIHELDMNVLLLRPVPANERFGLGPFFLIEPPGVGDIGPRARRRR